MTDAEELSSSERGEDTMLREAIEALRRGDRAHARDLLTRLLKTNQKNVQYWVWLSATVDTQKERLYCLQTAFQLDPQNAAAKRGLILLGGLPPDDSVPPFPVNRPRAWEQELAIPQEPREKTRGWANPVTRVFIVLAIAVAVVGLFIGGFTLLKGKRAATLHPLATSTHKPTFTNTFTPSKTPKFFTATPTFLGATPLWMFLEKTYTPTPYYVVTQHPITSRSAFETGLRFLGQKDYKNALVLFQQVEDLEPHSPDVYYYIAETYFAQGNFRTARDEYQKAINQDPNFAPAFLGRARSNLALNPDADVKNDLDQAVILDPRFAEAFLERGKYQLSIDPAAAESDFKAAVQISPDSALAYLYLANAQLTLGENSSALASAQRANQIDMTLVPVYLALARAYIAAGQSEKAVGALQTYSVYEPNDTSAFLALGTAYNAAGEYQMAVNILNKAIEADRKNAEAYYQRGFAYLSLEKGSLAEPDFKAAVIYDPLDFDSQIDLARALYMQDKPGDAYMQAETNALPLAKNNTSKAQVYYWEAIFLEGIDNQVGADVCWNRLIELPVDVMPAAWRTQAFEHLKITPTSTKTVPPTATRTKTFTPSVNPKSSQTPTPSVTPKFTPTPSPTKTLSATATPK
jgi:tetratricopeptide (TPR) repeat protein